jgi:hypothetical protein
MRALSSLDHRRRRPVPVISSIRRTSVTPPRPSALLSSLCSSVMSKSSLMGRHYATTRTPPKRGNEAPLTVSCDKLGDPQTASWPQPVETDRNACGGIPNVALRRLRCDRRKRKCCRPEHHEKCRRAAGHNDIPPTQPGLMAPTYVGPRQDATARSAGRRIFLGAVVDDAVMNGALSLTARRDPPRQNARQQPYLGRRMDHVRAAQQT